MPRIPTIQNRAQLSALPGVDIREAPAGVGLQSIGNALSDVANVVSQIQTEERNKADQAAFMEADRKLGETENTLLHDPVAGAYTKRAKDAIGITQSALGDFDKQASEIESTLKTDRQKLAFKQALNQRREQVQRGLQTHEGREREAYYTAERSAYKEQAYQEAVSNYKDVDRIEGAVDKIRATLDQTPGLSADERTAELDTRRSAVFAGVIDRYLANDELAGAERYYSAVKGRVNGEQAANIERAIATTKRRLESEKESGLIEMRRALDEQLRDNLTAAQFGLPVRVPSEKLLKAAYGDTHGAQKYRVATAAAQLSGDVAQMHQTPTGEILKKLESYKPTQTAGAADQAQMLGMLAESANAVIKARSADPAGYLVATAPNSTAAWRDFVEEGTPESRDAYFSALEADRERLQLPAGDVIPNDYADELANRIANPGSAESLATVLEVEQRRWGEHWPEVHQQVAPKLPDIAAVIGSGLDRSAQVTLASTAKLKDKELEALLPPGVKWANLEDNVVATFGDVRNAFPPEGVRTWEAMKDSAMRLAASYMHAGDNQENAIARAYTELVDKRYDIGQYRNVPFMVPREFDVGDVEDAADRFLQAYVPPIEALAIPAGAEDPQLFVERATEEFRDNAYWVQRADGLGLDMYLGTQPTGVSKTFEELQAATKARRVETEAMRQKAMIEAFERGGT